MRKVKIKPQHFYAADGRYLKTLKCFYNGKCPECGRDILRVSRFGRRLVLDAEQLFLLTPGVFGSDEIYTKEGVRFQGMLVKDPKLNERYEVGYRLHECK